MLELTLHEKYVKCNSNNKKNKIKIELKQMTQRLVEVKILALN